MIFSLLSVAAATTLTVTAPVAPATPPASTPNEEVGTEATGDANRLICRSVPQTGSRLGRQRVCQTAAQWQQARRDVRDRLERSQASRATTGG